MHSTGEAVKFEEPHDGSYDPFEPYVVLPTQIADTLASLVGEKRLMAAVLADAIQLYLKHARNRTASGQILFRETERWIESGDRSWLLSFENVCDVLNVNAARVREALHAHVREGVVRSIPSH